MARWNAIVWPVEDMRKWYEKDGMSVTDIATKLGKSPKLIWKVCNKHGFRMRPVGPPSGKKNPSWRGGRIVDKSGYVLVHTPDHPNANFGGYVREHRLVAESLLGRYLTPEEVVHHKDDDPSNNHPDNLLVYKTNAIHLADTIAGQVPKWTDDGKRRIGDGSRGKAGRIQVKPVEWPSDEDLHSMHIQKRMSLVEIAKTLGCGSKRLADRMHFRGVPVRVPRSTEFAPRRHVLPTTSILSPKELGDFLSQGIVVHPTRYSETASQCPSRTGDSLELNTTEHRSMSV